MSISRRKLLGLLPAISAVFLANLRAEAKPDNSIRSVLGYQLHDDVSVSLLRRYARSLALHDEKFRWEAQMMFHEAQLARRQGGTEGHRLGYRHQEAVEAYERGEEPIRVGHLWSGWKS